MDHICMHRGVRDGGGRRCGADRDEADRPEGEVAPAPTACKKKIARSADVDSDDGANVQTNDDSNVQPDASDGRANGSSECGAEHWCPNCGSEFSTVFSADACACDGSADPSTHTGSYEDADEDADEESEHSAVGVTDSVAYAGAPDHADGRSSRISPNGTSGGRRHLGARRSRLRWARPDAEFMRAS
jgi:hypothetical protein